MDTKRFLPTGLCILVLLVWFPALFNPALAQSKSEPIKVGVLISLTGAFLKQGPLVKEGIEMALEDAGWQVAGRKIVIIPEDDATDPTICLDKARKLVERDKVVAIIGPNHSGLANAIQPYLHKNKIINFKSMQFPRPLKAKYPYMIVLNGTQEQNCYPMGVYAYEELGYRKVTVLGPNYIAGRAFLGGFMSGFKEKGGTIVQEQWFSEGSIDFGPYLANLEKADALATWDGSGPGVLRLISQYHSYGITNKMPLVGAYASNLLDEDILPQLGDKGLGIYGPCAYASTLDNPINNRAVARFKAKHGGLRPSDMVMVGGYMNAFTLVHGLKATGGDTDADKLRAAILNLNLKDTPIGPLRFTPEGSGIMNIYIIKTVRSGTDYMWQVVHTYSDTHPR